MAVRGASARSHGTACETGAAKTTMGTAHAETSASALLPGCATDVECASGDVPVAGASAQAIRVLVKPVSGSGGVPLRVEPWQTVLHAKARVELATGVPADEQRLVTGGRELRDDAQFAECGLRSGSSIQLLRRVSGGSAAARAQLAMKKKKERQALMDSLKDDDSDSDEEAWHIPERPDCVESMSYELETLMAKQFDLFQTHLLQAIEDPGESQERLEMLESVFDKVLYRGFVQNKGFYPIDHDFATVVQEAAGGTDVKDKMGHGDSEEDEDMAEMVAAMPVWQRVPHQIVTNPSFKNFIVFAIVVAGIIVGTNTYLSCDGQT